MIAPLRAVPADAPLDPSPGEARSWLQRELLNPEYHQQNVVQRLVTWLERQIGRGLAAAEQAPPLSTFAAMLIFLLLLGGLIWLLSRTRGTGRARNSVGPVLDAGDVVTAAELRARAEAALAGGRPEEALVDGFRALAVRQVERGRLDDSPGATAHEVAMSLATRYPQHGERVGDGARLFDLVLYGDRLATPEQATGVLTLDDELAGAR